MTWMHVAMVAIAGSTFVGLAWALAWSDAKQAQARAQQKKTKQERDPW